MRKKMTAAFLLWLFFLLLISFTTFWADSSYGVLAITVWILLPILSWSMNFYVRKNLEVKIIVEPTASKREEKQITLILKNSGMAAVGKALCQLEIQNTLTGEKQLHTLEIPVRAKDDAKGVLQMVFAHCGYIRIKLVNMMLTDCFGFLPLRCHVTAHRKIDILPDIFQTQVSLQLHNTAAEDALSWSEEQKGDDYTEIFSLRDYVEGDSMKQIHWKLSSKRNTLITKEASQPVTRSLLLFWDKNTGETAPSEMDAMAEVVASISQAVMEMGILFTLGWTEEQGCMYEEIENENDLIQKLPRILKEGARPWEDAFVAESLQKRGRYGKIIYFAKTIPDHIEEIRNENIAFVLCDREAEAACCFKAENYMQDMEVVEL